MYIGCESYRENWIVCIVINVLDEEVLRCILVFFLVSGLDFYRFV